MYGKKVKVYSWGSEKDGNKSTERMGIRKNRDLGRGNTGRALAHGLVTKIDWKEREQKAASFTKESTGLIPLHP